jgi:hypothetical protein
MAKTVFGSRAANWRYKALALSASSSCGPYRDYCSL